MRGSSVMKLLVGCCGGLLVSIPVHAQKKVFDRRTGEDKGSSEDCVAAGYRYIEVEAFDYNLFPNITVNYTQIAGECGETNFAPYTESFVYDGTRGTKNGRRQMDMYICAPFGEYELQIEVRSTNGDGNPLANVAWEIEYGPDQFHLWDTLNTPHFNTRNGATMADVPYAPIPPEYSGSGPGTIYKWPLPKSVGYYSTLYTGPFPPKHCPNRYPAGVAYEGCYPRQSEESGWTAPTQGPVGPTGKFGDRSETERMFDGLGIDDKGLEQDGVMTIENCERICKDEANGGPYLYMGLQSAVQCVCGNSIEGDHVENCGLEDDLEIPEYEFLCSGDSQVLCGTDTMVSIYSLGGDSTAPAPTPPAPTPPVATLAPPALTPSGTGSYELLGCSVDNVPKRSRVMTYGPIKRDIMSAEICFDICTEVGYNTYFGTEYSVECFCATTADEVELLELEFGGCTMPCADPDVDPEEVADSDREKCGGENAISVYKIGGDGTGPAPTPPAPTPAAPIPLPTDAPPAPMPPPAPTSSGGDSYELKGCTYDSPPRRNRVMEYGPIQEETMSAERCFDICTEADGDYKYFGTEWGIECFCDTTLEDNLNLEYGGCDMPCADPDVDGTGVEDSDREKCGGYKALSVYKIGAAGPAPTPPLTAAPNAAPTADLAGAYDEIGCFADDQPGLDGKEVRIMGDKTTSNDMNAEVCFGLCNDGTNTHFGTQYGKECWCVYDPELQSITQFADVVKPCDMRCVGNPEHDDERCGGYDAMTVYEMDS
eukprot:g18615.t1